MKGKIMVLEGNTTPSLYRIELEATIHFEHQQDNHFPFISLFLQLYKLK